MIDVHKRMHTMRAVRLRPYSRETSSVGRTIHKTLRRPQP